ncbi:MAG: phosphatase PAP2/dual specificity phosphatase family protein [Planctomycetota bacterium]|jgi:membrane-associated phospholipid phosphatase
MLSHDTTRRPWREAVFASAGCSLLFVVVYGVTNTLASMRGAAGTFYGAWELSIPLVPAMVVPYMSIDLFFVAAPFICSSAREVRTFAKRVCTAILVAGIFFVMWPLTPGFERVEVAGPFGPLFDSLYVFDQPFNLFPSLHVTLAFILRWTYHRHLRGPRLWLFHGWFVLVTASTLFTHQHHVIDVAGGAALAIVVFYLFPTGRIARDDVRVARAPSPRLGCAYGAAAAVFVAMGWTVRGWSWIACGVLVWTALALSLVAAGYAGLGPRVFRKYAGYLSIPARVVLAPYLVGLWLSRRWYRARDPRGFAGVGGGVFFGRLPDAELTPRLLEAGVRSVVDLTAEHSEPRRMRELHYATFPVLDLAAPEEELLDAVADHIERSRSRGGAVYVHCALGYGRSGAAIAWWLHRSGRAESLAAARERVHAARSPRGSRREGCLDVVPA